MAKVFKWVIAAGQQLLLAFSSYEYGKNSELENSNKLQIARSFDTAHTAEIDSDNNSTKNIWIVIGLIAFATGLYIINELKNCLMCKNRNTLIQNPIEMQTIQVQPRAAVRNQVNPNERVEINVNA